VGNLRIVASGCNILSAGKHATGVKGGKCSNEKYVPVSTFCDVVKLMSLVKSGFIFLFRLLTCTANSWNSTTDFKNSLTIVNIK